MITPSTFKGSNAIADVKRFCEVSQYAAPDSEEYMLGMMLAVHATEYITKNIDMITASMSYRELVLLTKMFQICGEKVEEFRRDMMNSLEKDDDYDS